MTNLLGLNFFRFSSSKLKLSLVNLNLIKVFVNLIAGLDQYFSNSPVSDQGWVVSVKRESLLFSQDQDSGGEIKLFITLPYFHILSD